MSDLQTDFRKGKRYRFFSLVLAADIILPAKLSQGKVYYEYIIMSVFKLPVQNGLGGFKKRD